MSLGVLGVGFRVLGVWSFGSGGLSGVGRRVKALEVYGLASEAGGFGWGALEGLCMHTCKTPQPTEIPVTP